MRVSASDTSKVPNASPTAASSGSDINGMAARAAAATLRERLAAFAAQRFHCTPADVSFAGGRVRAGEHALAFAELVDAAYHARVQLSATGFYATPKIHYDRTTLSGRPFFYFAYGAAVSEVAIDTLTGEHRLCAVDILHDVGASLNPAIDRGQIEGGFMQGWGWLTMEELALESPTARLRRMRRRRTRSRRRATRRSGSTSRSTTRRTARRRFIARRPSASRR